MQTAKERSFSDGNTKIYLSWNKYLKYIDELINNIKSSNIKIDYIYGIPRGGLIPATIMSHEFNVPLIDAVTGLKAFFKIKNKVILLVDDIIDNGNTIKKYSRICFKQKCKSVVTASIFKHKKCKDFSNYYCCLNDVWIVFPYEKD